jgi:hypothetical protein
MEVVVVVVVWIMFSPERKCKSQREDTATIDDDDGRGNPNENFVGRLIYHRPGYATINCVQRTHPLDRNGRGRVFRAF